MVLEAAPGSLIYAGLQPGVDRAALERELANGSCEACFHAFQPRVGDCVFLPAGTVHAIGGGLLIAELQQASDCTFRLFDWNRVGPDGKPRQLHIEQALEVIDFTKGPVTPQTPAPTDQPHVSRLVACDKFVLDRWNFDRPRELRLDNACRLLIVLEGSVFISGDMSDELLGTGDTVFLPAILDEIELRPTGPAVLLCAKSPEKWGMGNGEWGMGNGEWGMGNGEWGMGNGEWGMEARESRLSGDACYVIPHLFRFLHWTLKPALQAGRCCQ